MLTVLQKDKRICKDMLYEDAKVVTFVHQPISYLKVSELYLLMSDES